jgi:ABC-type transporter Mla subunit MlaD
MSDDVDPLRKQIEVLKQLSTELGEKKAALDQIIQNLTEQADTKEPK